MRYFYKDGTVSGNTTSAVLKIPFKLYGSLGFYIPATHTLAGVFNVEVSNHRDNDDAWSAMSFVVDGIESTDIDVTSATLLNEMRDFMTSAKYMRIKFVGTGAATNIVDIYMHQKRA